MKSMMTFFAFAVCIGFFGASGPFGFDAAIASAANRSVKAMEPRVAPNPYRNERRETGELGGREQIGSVMAMCNVKGVISRK